MLFVDEYVRWTYLESQNIEFGRENCVLQRDRVVEWVRFKNRTKLVITFNFGKNLCT